MVWDRDEPKAGDGDGSGAMGLLFPDVLASRLPELVRLEPGIETPVRELWMLVHPSWREVRSIEVAAAWVAASVREFREGG